MNTKITAEDVFTSFYEAFNKLQQLNPGESEEEKQVAQVEVETTLKECSQLLEKYVDFRVKKTIKKLYSNG